MRLPTVFMWIFWEKLLRIIPAKQKRVESCMNMLEVRTGLKRSTAGTCSASL